MLQTGEVEKTVEQMIHRSLHLLGPHLKLVKLCVFNKAHSFFSKKRLNELHVHKYILMCNLRHRMSNDI